MIALWSGLALAQSGAPPESQATVQPRAPSPGGLEAFALFQARASASDLVSTNPLLDGQVVGRLGGTNGIEVDPAQVSAYTEQRANVFLTWAPPLLEGKASLTGAFEIDFAYGDRAYGSGGNVGGGFGGDQVNLQTRRLHADWFPEAGRHHAHISLGLQFIGDSVADPTRVSPDGLLRSGGRLAYLGSEAAGIAVYGTLSDRFGPRLRYRLGAFTLLEQGLSLPDDVLLAVADAELRPAYATAVGAHLWYVQDRSTGTGGALGVGPTSALWELQGGPRLDLYDGLQPPADVTHDADLIWLGADAGHNAALDRGPLGLHGVAVANLGRIYAPIVHDDDVVGFSLDAEVRLRIARGAGSVARIEALYSSGGGVHPDRYGGVVTGNAYGVAGALMPTHGTLLLFPDATAINRMVSVISDLSGGGEGIAGVSASVGYDPIPGRLNGTVGIASALTAAGVPWGTELNARVTVEPVLFCDVGLAVATVRPGPAAQIPAPWTVLATLNWLVL